MMTTRAFSHLLMAVALAATSLAASADVIQYTDRTTFSGLGSIGFNYGFDDLDTSLAATGGTGLFFTGDPWTTHGVTYNTGSNLVIGPSSGLGLTSNVFTSNSSNPGGLASGTLGGSYDLFGFDAGTILGSSTVNITINTNLGAYRFLNQAAAAEPASSFFGFRAAAGEYFTSFLIADLAAGTVPSIDNVTLGIASPVPEPEAFSLLLPGLLLLMFAARRRG